MNMQDNPIARAGMSLLAHRHRLGFVQNPGGGEFFKEGWGRCQIGMCDDDEDLATLKQWVAEMLDKEKL